MLVFGSSSNIGLRPVSISATYNIISCNLLVGIIFLIFFLHNMVALQMFFKVGCIEINCRKLVARQNDLLVKPCWCFPGWRTYQEMKFILFPPVNYGDLTFSMYRITAFGLSNYFREKDQQLENVFLAICWLRWFDFPTVPHDVWAKQPLLKFKLAREVGADDPEA